MSSSIRPSEFGARFASVQLKGQQVIGALTLLGTRAGEDTAHGLAVELRDLRTALDSTVFKVTALKLGPNLVRRSEGDLRQVVRGAAANLRLVAPGCGIDLGGPGGIGRLPVDAAAKLVDRALEEAGPAWAGIRTQLRQAWSNHAHLEALAGEQARKQQQVREMQARIRRLKGRLLDAEAQVIEHALPGTQAFEALRQARPPRSVATKQVGPVAPIAVIAEPLVPEHVTPTEDSPANGAPTEVVVARPAA